MKSIKNLVPIILIAGLCVFIAACGKKHEDNSKQGIEDNENITNVLEEDDDVIDIEENDDVVDNEEDGKNKETDADTGVEFETGESNNDSAIKDSGESNDDSVIKDSEGQGSTNSKTENQTPSAGDTKQESDKDNSNNEDEGWTGYY